MNLIHNAQTKLRSSNCSNVSADSAAYYSKIDLFRN